MYLSELNIKPCYIGNHFHIVKQRILIEINTFVD
jgi:hypothetical protein